jgi:hypothetical protein
MGCVVEKEGLYHIPGTHRPKRELENGNRVGVKKAILNSKKGLQTYPVLVARQSENQWWPTFQQWRCGSVSEICVSQYRKRKRTRQEQGWNKLTGTDNR